MVTKGRIRQSLCYWCLNSSQWAWDFERICRAAHRLQVESVELVPPEMWKKMSTFYVTCALAPNGMPDPVFTRGVNNTSYHEEVIATTKRTIDLCSDFGVPNVLAFSGYKWRKWDDPASGEISLEEGADNAVKALTELGRYAEQKSVNVCFEQLNTRDDSHPMKGHPGYQADNIDYCADIVKRVGSPRVKLLFDAYHVQIMNGDVIRRIRQYAPLIGHVHIAGVPGRGEMDEDQEVNWAAVMRALVDVGYRGYVGLEYLPSREPMESLSQMVTLCDV